MNFRYDERGAFFVFGPLWFVVLVIIIYIIYSAAKGNTNRSTHRRTNYNPNGLSYLNGRQCSNCLTMNTRQAKYCQNCGTQLY